MDLAKNFTPKSLDEFIGQEHLLGENAILKSMLESKSFENLILFGPPGSGKSSLARIIGGMMNFCFLQFNATNFKLEELKQDIKSYQNTFIKPLVFIDEIHRLNITQQDFLLPLLEKRQIYLIGASTFNPFYSLSVALRSRSILLELKKVKFQELEILYERVIKKHPPKHSFKIKHWLLNNCNFDFRILLNLLEIALKIDKTKEVKEDMLKQIITHNEGSENHYDLISAFIKSIRGSDENASIYYLSRLVNAQVEPSFIARRLVILASEDIGNANPNALNLATSCLVAVKNIGYPEARIILSQCSIYLASSPKSNTAYKAINNAMACNKNYEVPMHLRNNALNYKYPHDFGGYIKQEYFFNEVFVESKLIGFETTLNQWLLKIRGESF